MNKPIIIIGAGAAGLMAARELGAAGHPVIVLEAGASPGGRIRTLRGGGFSGPVEEGAEFVHGKLPLTLQLLEEANIPYHPVKGKMLQFKDGNWVVESLFSDDWDVLMEKMGDTRKDMTLAAFLRQEFAEEKYKGLRESAIRYAEGFDLADPETVSVRYLYGEWEHEGEGQYRVEGGYGRLIDWMAEVYGNEGASIHLSSAVKEIIWEKDAIRVITEGGAAFHGGKIIVTVSPAVLLRGAIRFAPAIDARLEAFGNLGFGSITKMLLEFKTAFWRQRDKNMGFLISDQRLPTWWTQLPDEYPLLTGWIPGAAMGGLAGMAEDALTELALVSLAGIFSMDIALLKKELVAAKSIDWSAEPYIWGGYSFDTVKSVTARKLLNEPVEQTLFFAGEALHEGDWPGTVEAALDSGKVVAQKIIGLLKG
jgi:monoamine oxidase